MKIRSKLEFTDALDKNLAKRKRALSNLLAAYVRSRPHEAVPFAYAAVCLLYGHWEGFIKFAATCYVNYVASQRLRCRDLSAGILSLTIRERLRSSRQSKRLGIHREVVEGIRERSHETAKLSWRDSIETFDNLSTEVLSEIIATLGLEPGYYLAKKLIIDDRLLGRRNTIAHSGYAGVEDVEYQALHSEVVALMERFRDDLENAVTRELYRRAGDEDAVGDV